jgi:excinuclease ABC subunit C
MPRRALRAILQRVLENHYQTVDSVEIPSVILAQHELPEAEILADYLTQRRGRKVTIEVPQRQTKADLIDMVERNAQYELARTQAAADRNLQSLQDLAVVLDLPDLPKRIEGYDISHIQGSDAVASQVVFVDGLPAKQHYRHYKIKNPEVKPGHSDDFASMAEVIRRRFRRYAADPTKPRLGNPDWPDLVMIDGGKGQLSAVVEVLKDLNLLQDLNVVSLAKKREEIFLPGESNPSPPRPISPEFSCCAVYGTKPTALPSASIAKNARNACAAPACRTSPASATTASGNCSPPSDPSTTSARPAPNNWPPSPALAPNWPSHLRLLPSPGGRGG